MAGLNLKNPLTQRYIIIALLGVGLIYGWYAYIYSPNQTDIAQKQTTLEELEVKVQQGRMKAANLAKLKEESLRLWAEYKALEPLLPSKHEITSFLSETQRAAYSSGIQVTSLVPQKQEAVDFYFKNPYRISVSGTYHNMGKFLARVANFPFITSASEVVLAQQKATPQNPVTVIATMTIIAYNVKAEATLQEPNFESMGIKGPAKSGGAGGTVPPPAEKGKGATETPTPPKAGG